MVSSTRVRCGYRVRDLAALLICLALSCLLAYAQDDGIALSVSRSGPSGIALAWSGGSSPFDVYRSTSPAAVFSGGSRIGQTSASNWNDTPPAGALVCYGVKNVPDDVRIQTARSQPDGPVNIHLVGPIVTYVKPAVGSEPAGFFVQSTQSGPALFVAVDPASLPDPPVVGDKASFTITVMGTSSGLREALFIANYTRLSTGNPIAGLVQDVSANADLVTDLGDFDSELISLTGTISESFHAAGSGFVSARIATAGLPLDPNFQFRPTSAVVDLLDLVNTCQIRVTNSVLWRFNAVAEPGAWKVADVTPLSCPPPTVVTATALSPTTVAVDFTRRIDPSSVDSFGSQFAFSGGLVATGASVSARRVTVTTSPQTPNASYTVTVSGTVRDMVGSGIGIPNSAMFTGFVVPAVLRINEVNPNITGAKDLVELLTVSAGSTAGIKLEQGIGTPTLLATLPDIQVAAGDIIVIHLNPGTGEAPSSETLSKTQYPTATYSNNYDTAWDVNGGATGMTFSDRVIVLRPLAGGILDAAPFVIAANPTVSSFPPDLQSIQAAGAWLPADCGGALCTDTSTPTAHGVSIDWSGVGTTRLGLSVQRFPTSDTNSRSDWKPAGAQSFGLPNPP